MPECKNCGNEVTKRYMRVFAPEEDGDPTSCPKCTLGRDSGSVETEDTGDDIDWRAGE